MEDLPSRRLEGLSVHIEGLEAALASEPSAESLGSLRRLARSLARAAQSAGLSEILARARAVQDAPEEELLEAVRALLELLRSSAEDAAAVGHEILVVEDDRTIAAAVLSYLKEPGRTLHHAGTASEAEGILASRDIGLVILDLILPDRDGRDLLLQLREDPRTAALPVIVLSARAGGVARAECLAVGANDFLEKPADPKLLRSAVARCLRERKPDADARLDPATGVLSRAGLTDAHRALRSRTGKVESPLAVALLTVSPLDHVSRVLGAGAADQLLRAVAEHVGSALEERDRIGRWTEAALVVLFPGTSPPIAFGRIEAGLTALTSGGTLERHQDAGIEVSFSAGLAVADAGTDLREAALAAEQSARPAIHGTTGIIFAAEDRDPAEYPRVLLVEDDRVTATLIQHRLVREGFDVMDFLNGEDAFRWAVEGRFDLAILDVKVPGMDGFELLERMRAIPRLEGVPIIMLTSLGSEADVVRGLELGANDYMLKPFSPAELLARVRRLAAEALELRGGPGSREGGDSEASDR